MTPSPGTSEQLVTLCFIVQENRVLLMRKKRGVGAGKINAPGGKVEPGETPLAAAIRETREEVCVTPLDLELRGQLRFHFAGGLTWRCLIYLAERCHGEPRETAEAEPCWYPLDAVPYGEMWEDDRTWLPMLLAGRQFEGEVQITGERVSSQDIHVIEKDINISI